MTFDYLLIYQPLKQHQNDLKIITVETFVVLIALWEGVMLVDDQYLARQNCCESGDTEQFSSPILSVILKMYNQDTFHRNTSTKKKTIVFL